MFLYVFVEIFRTSNNSSVESEVSNRMGTKSFKTDKRLWFWISLILFLVTWFIPDIGEKRESIISIISNSIFSDTPNSFRRIITPIVGQMQIYGILAIFIGWVVQAIIVVFRGKLSQQRER